MQFVYPTWPVSAHIQAATTTRLGGVSGAPYDSFNLATHVGDAPEAVRANRTRLCQMAGLPEMPHWLNQSHSTRVLNLDRFNSNQDLPYDACYTSKPNTVCAVLTADCLPILLCSIQTGEIAAIHAGWRGLCQGIIEQTCRFFESDPKDMLAWFGPAIGPTKFEVGSDVKNAFEAVSANARSAFLPCDKDEQKYLANLYELARQGLHLVGITAIYGGEYCTVSQPDLFFSYRNSPITGRMASFIWRQE